MTELLDLRNSVGYSLQHGISMKTVEDVGEIRFSHDVAIRHGFDEASGGKDSCLTFSWNANFKFSGDEVVDKFACGERVHAFGRWCVPFVTNGDEGTPPDFFSRCHRSESDDLWRATACEKDVHTESESR